MTFVERYAMTREMALASEHNTFFRDFLSIPEIQRDVSEVLGLYELKLPVPPKLLIGGL